MRRLFAGRLRLKVKERASLYVSPPLNQQATEAKFLLEYVWVFNNFRNGDALGASAACVACGSWR